MSRRPGISGRKLIAGLKRLGFEVIRIKGSHHYLRHPDGRATVVPVHASEDIGRGLLSKILRDTEVTAVVLKKYLYQCAKHVLHRDACCAGATELVGYASTDIT